MIIVDLFAPHKKKKMKTDRKGEEIASTEYSQP